MVSQGKVSEFAKLREKTMTLVQGEMVILDWCQKLHRMMILEFEHILSRNKSILFHKAKQFESPPFFETWGSRGNTWQVSEVSLTDIKISNKCVYMILFPVSHLQTSRPKIPITCFPPKPPAKLLPQYHLLLSLRDGLAIGRSIWK